MPIIIRHNKYNEFFFIYVYIIFKKQHFLLKNIYTRGLINIFFEKKKRVYPRLCQNIFLVKFFSSKTKLIIYAAYFNKLIFNTSINCNLGLRYYFI